MPHCRCTRREDEIFLFDCADPCRENMPHRRCTKRENEFFLFDCADPCRENMPHRWCTRREDEFFYSTARTDAGEIRRLGSEGNFSAIFTSNKFHHITQVNYTRKPSLLANLSARQYRLQKKLKKFS